MVNLEDIRHLQFAIFHYTFPMIYTLPQLAWRDLLSHKGKLFSGILALTIGIATSLLLIAIVTSARNIASTTVRASMNANQVKVVPKYSVGFFKVTKQEQRKIDGTALEDLKNIPGVTDLQSEEILQVPASLEVSFFGSKFVTDSPIYGIPDNAFTKLEETSLDPKDTDTIPVLISQELVDIYNIGIASAINQPAINEEILSGFEMDIMLGTSSFLNGNSSIKKSTRHAKVVGVVEGIPIVGVTLPESILDEIHHDSLEHYDGPLYSRVFLTIAPSANMEDVLQHVSDLGFQGTSGAEEQARVQHAFSSIELFFFLLVGVIISLVVLSFLQFFYGHRMEKKWLLSLLSALGGNKKDLKYFFLAQVFYFIVLGTIPGIILGYVLILGLNILLTNLAGTLLSFSPLLSLPLLDSSIMILALLLLLFLVALHPASQAAKALPQDGVV